MLLNTPNLLTLLRIALIPAFIAAYYLARPWAHMLATGLFILAALTDWLDGYLARRFNESSAFGRFLDPVADKLMVATALVLLLSYDPRLWLTISVIIIIGREITISALREWMAELGVGKHITVSFVGKVKTTVQMLAIGFMLFQYDLGPIHAYAIGVVLLFAAAGLTLWSMVLYLIAAWPDLSRDA